MHSATELFTKDVCQDLIFITNSLGCRFIGHPMIEATGSFKNFLTWQKNPLYAFRKDLLGSMP